MTDLNADFTQRASAHGSQIDWESSPMPGVERRKLERIGDEVARATTIVRYAPGSKFSPHVHTGGEEFIVLDGVFEDEHGAFPVGSYIRNPPESSHTPGSEPGCTILVKLWQFDMADRTHVRQKMDNIADFAVEGRDGVRIQPLFRDTREDVRVETWAPGAKIDFTPNDGLEIFVLSGGFEEGGENFEKDSWLRLPVGTALNAVAGDAGAKIYVKEGHLPFAKAPAV